MNAGATMAKKKSGEDLKLAAVKIERDILTMARMIAAKRGRPVAVYLSESLRTIVERDWAKMVKEANEERES